MSSRPRRNYGFRVFISYSHDDAHLAGRLVTTLRSIGLNNIWDKDIHPGRSFVQEIKGFIEHVHLFMPLITVHSQNRPWIHEEIGFATALNVPVLPIAIGEFPQEMIASLHAISVT